jgi:hypothetical protein
MFVSTLVILLICSLALNVFQKVKQMKTSTKGKAALEAIAEVANYVQNAIVSSEKVDEIKTKITAEALKTVVGQTFIRKGINQAIKEDLKSLWAKGLAKIQKIL